MLRKAENFLRYLFGILMMLAGAGYWKEEGICIVKSFCFRLPGIR